MNESTMPLSSNPPSQSDLATAKQTLNPESKVKIQDVSLPSVLVCPPTLVLIPLTRPQPIPSEDESPSSPPPPRPRTSRPDDPRRYSKIFESDDGKSPFTGYGTGQVDSNIPPLTAAGPGITTTRKTPADYNQPDSFFNPPSTIAEESTPDVESEVEPAENISESDLVTPGFQSPGADNNEAEDEPFPASHGDEHNNDDEANDADDESCAPIIQPSNFGASFEEEVQSSRGDWRHSSANEVCDPKDPRYDVSGAARKSSKHDRPESNTFKAEQATQTLSDDGDGDGDGRPSIPYKSLQRDFTNASLVPVPLSLPMRRNNTIHETSSSAIASTSAAATTEHAPRPASAADVDNSPLEPEIETQRPRSFVIREWPPQNRQNATFDNAPRRQALWHTPPSQEIIERSRRVREQMEWEEAAKTIVLQKARDAGETLSDEDVARRVRRMYERSSRFTLEPATYDPATPPAQPSDTVPANRDHNARVRARRASLPGNAIASTSQTNRPARPARPESSFVPPQALQFTASTTSVTAQDGSHSGSPPLPPRNPRRSVRRSNPQDDSCPQQ
ncbi:hypothetical protein F4801DRAFT_552657 [Xylaria longipes]|nr:hypothetical protein F4801DRAFT_552657 [Xylaria longipes]